tara:strand:- start:257 stop:1993 length:1737 start_codon:yes stop_codon:yes gene_type:complete
MIKTKGLNGAQAFLKVLGTMGVERIFASPGSEWAPVWEALAEPNANDIPIYMSTRHEETAIGMASGYAKATGKLPAVMIHTTVGALHGAMAMRGALHEEVPMVIFAGESIGFGEDDGPDPGGQWGAHLADMGGPARMVEKNVKWSFGVNTKSILPSTVRRACSLAMAGPRGPTFVSLPMEHLFEEMPRNVASGLSNAPLSTADQNGVVELAELLSQAKDPVIVAEDVGRSVKASEHLRAIAELLGCPVSESRATGSINIARNHPLHAGFHPASAVKDADVIFLASSITPWHPQTTTPSKEATVAVLDENPQKAILPFLGIQADLILTGNLETSLLALLEALKVRVAEDDKIRIERKTRLKYINDKRRETWKQEAEALSSTIPMDTRWVTYQLGQVIPDDALIIEELITHRLAAHQYLDRLKPGCWFSGAQGGLGTGLSTALGVKTAYPDRPVVCLIGDGSFNYDPVPAVYGAAQEHNLPFLTIILNNHGYLSQKTGVPKYFPEGDAVKTNNFSGLHIGPAPDYWKIIDAFGGFGEKVEEPGEVRAAIKRGLEWVAKGRASLLDIRLKPVSDTLNRTDK